MNKKINTLLFILGATLFNVIVAMLSIFVFIFLYSRSPLPHMISENGSQWSVILIFISGIAVSIFVYRIVLKFLLKKIDVEKYFDPLFVKNNLKVNIKKPDNNLPS